MDHAWLDSLSEDWPSQPSSNNSAVEPGNSLGKPARVHSSTQKFQENKSKLPAPKSTNKLQQPKAANEGSSRVLSERSLNDVNIPSSIRRAPSKLSQEVRFAEGRGRQLSRTVSASTSGSVVHNTVQTKSLSASPSKVVGNTPEWKRRLIYGEVAYGERKDLFSTAGTGLENMFNPPTQEPRKAGQVTQNNGTVNDSELQVESTLPSSPPSFARRPSASGTLDEESASIELPAAGEERPQNHMRYRLQDDTLAGDDTRYGSSRMSSDLDMMQSAGLELSNEGSVQHHVLQEIESRKASGQSVIQNEDFSPILLSRHTTDDGKAVFTPAEVPAEQLRGKLEKLRRNQMLLDMDGGGEVGSFRVDDTADVQEIDNHINFRRGGRSADGSFQHHLLSSAFNDSSGLLNTDSIQASTPKQFPTIKIFPDDSDDLRPGRVPIPAAPYPSPEKEPRLKPAGQSSPLKLFGPYDTFTNQTLLRRISQFEEQTTDGSRSSGRPSVESGEFHQKHDDEDNRSISGARSAPMSAMGSRITSEHASRNVSYFGVGHLDGFEFNEDIPRHVDSVLSDDETEDEMSNNGSGSADDSDHLVVQRQRLSLRGKPPTLTEAIQNNSSQGEIEPLQPPRTPTRSAVSEGKRPRTSPSKDPTPKRRRTLHKTDIAYRLEGPGAESQVVQLTETNMRTFMGKKRKDARPGDIGHLAEAEVLATRQILRPRAPTPSQRSSVRKEHSSFAEDDPEFDETPELDEMGNTLSADEQPETQRKPSIKTEDFIDQANQIMRMIRMKAGRTSDLEKLDEAQERQPSQEHQAEDSYEESTRDPFERPPSREAGGRMMPRMPNKQEDPNLVQYLKQYEEQGDTRDIISSSIRSVLTTTKAAVRTETIQIADGESVISDPPNIRISGQLRSQDILDEGYPSNGSSNTSGGNTNRSIPTGSSRGSDSRKTIAPETVAHLIPEQVGVMVFDKQRNVWVKTKIRASPRSKRRNTATSEFSEDDPFQGIPDLTVDLSNEFQRLGVQDMAHRATQLDDKSRESSGNTVRAQAGSVKDFASFEHAQDHDVRENIHSSGRPRTPEKRTQPVEEAVEEVVEHEISIDEDRGTSSRRRNLTISFSSPIASIIEEAIPEMRSANHPAPAVRQSSVRAASQSRRPSRSTKQRPVSLGGRAFMPRPISRIEERDEELSFLQQDVGQSRDISIIGDRSVQGIEASESPKASRHTSLSFMITTPAKATTCPVDGVNAGPVISQYVGMLSLSPLSEFTAHDDQSLALEASYTVGNHHLTTADGKKKTVSHATGELVERLNEIEPYEPHWEDMQDLDLHDRQLSNVQMLDEFCGSLVRLDASRNALRNLTGVPHSVRELKISHNALSDLTSWAHLMNLQYVDISNNGLTSLSVFRHLVHLRSLRADNNRLTSLEGVKYHDGLQVLRARGNLLEEVDFGSTGLRRLTELDLKNNKIRRFENVDQLGALLSLNMEKNELDNLDFGAQEHALPLRYLEISDNKLSVIHLNRVPSLRLLHADRNRIEQLCGLSKARRLDSLSLREQQGVQKLDLSFLSAACEVRKLYLSGNLLEAFTPQVDFLNLQLLELANCGLRALPEDLGQMMPNLRVINLGFNAIPSLEPLRFISRLKRLLVAGNRLTSPAEILEVVADFPYLSTLDVRQNPVTQGFYPTPMQQVVVRQNADESDISADMDPFKLPDADLERDSAFASRLDMETAMRRRVYEQTFREQCVRLRKLDGLPIRGRRADPKRLEFGDAVWMALAKEGLILNDDGNAIEVDDEVMQKAERSSRWEAENSFA